MAGRYEKAAQGYRQVIDTAQDTMTRLLIEKLSTAPGFTTPAEEEPANAVEESPYTAASRLYEALCLIEMGQQREAVQRLEAFVDEDPATKRPPPEGGAEQIAAEQATMPAELPGAEPLLFRGQGLLELGRLALEHDPSGGLDRAEGYFERLDHWLTHARADNEDWRFGELLPGVRQAAKARTDGPPREYRPPDPWGNVKASAIDPGMLVNRKTTPWYLDDLEEDSVKYRVFFGFLREDKQQAKTHLQRILELDPTMRQQQRAGIPTDYSRLKWAIEHGHIIAHQPDLALYNDRQKTAIFLGDYYQITEHWQRGIDIYQAMLDGRFGELTSAQRDYVHFAIATCLAWQDQRDESRRHLELVLKANDKTHAERRAALSLGTVLLGAKREDDQRRGVALLRSLRASGDDLYAHRAQLNLAQAMLARGEHERGVRMLRTMPESAGSMKTLADWLLKEIRKNG